MTIQDLQNGTIEVFGNGQNLVLNNDYAIINTNLQLNLNWTYPQLNAIDDPLLGRQPHPFVAFSGGFEEGQNGFNTKLGQVLNGHNPNIFHNRKITTPVHINYDKNPNNVDWEKPDLFETGNPTIQPPVYNGNIVEDAVQVGHNFVSQTANGLYDKACHELWRLQQSGINRCFFIALYSHKQNLTQQEMTQMNINYVISNINADINYAFQLGVYRNDISQIDPNYIHLIFKGTRQANHYTYYNVLIMELPQGLNFNVIQGHNGVRLRP